MYVKQIKTKGAIPPPRYAHCLVPCGDSHLLLICGEDEKRIFSDFYLLNLETYHWTLIEISQSYCRTGQTATVIDDERVLLFGGNDLYQVQNDVLIVDPRKLQIRTVNTYGTLPMPCCGHSAVLGIKKEINYETTKNNSELKINYRKILIIFGGENDTQYLNQTYALYLDTKEWKRIDCGSTCPKERRSHSSVVSDDRSRMWMFGGRQDDGSLFDDLWCFDIQSEKWNQIYYCHCPRPCPRSGHRSVHVPDTNYIVVSGGWNSKTVMNDFWIFDFDREIWIKMNTRDGVLPPPRSAHALVCADDGSIYVFGGSHVGVDVDSLDDLWRLEFSETMLRSHFYQDILSMSFI